MYFDRLVIRFCISKDKNASFLGGNSMSLQNGFIILNHDYDLLFHNDEGNYYFQYNFDIIKSHIEQRIFTFCITQYVLEVSVYSQNREYYVVFQTFLEQNRLQHELEELRNIRNELNEVIQSSFDGIVIVDHTGKIIFQNRSYEKITGIKVADCIGRNLKELLNENIIDISASLKVLEEKKSVTITQKTNTGATVLVSAVPIKNSQDEIIKVVNNVRDLTTLNSMQAEIAQLEKLNVEMNQELQSLRNQMNPKFTIVANSDEMNYVVNRALKIANVDSTILIQGPTGVGKEKIVELIHYHSLRKHGPFIKINCGAIPENLLETELFGYENGAFTGANTKGKKGLFEIANEGTLFLDEIGEMPLHLQVKLLRVLQQKEITRVGGNTPIPINVRVIAATHRDLKSLVQEDRFREDLYYRLNVIPIHIPSLHERKADIIPLIYFFLKEFNEKYQLNKQFSKEVLLKLENLPWPGNIRQLQNFVERITLLSPADVIELDDIIEEFENESFIEENNLINVAVDQKKKNPHVLFSQNNLLQQNLSYKDLVTKFETHLIQEALHQHQSIRKAALHLKMNQSTLVRKIQKLKSSEGFDHESLEENIEAT